MNETMKVYVRYRLAKLYELSSNTAINHERSLQEMVKSALEGMLGGDVNSRIEKLIEHSGHSLCLHFHEHNTKSLVFDILHLNDNREVPTFERPNQPVPVSNLSVTKIPTGHMGMYEPAYVMISGNHVAVIERIGLKSNAISTYLNVLLHKSGQLDTQKRCWRLIPKIEAPEGGVLSGGVEKIIFKPHAALDGKRQPEGSFPDGRKVRNRKIDEIIAYGGRIIDILRAAGSDEADIEKLRNRMSRDLVIKAKVELTVSKRDRGTSAKLSADDVQTAFAGISEDADITVVDKDGKKSGNLTQLSHLVEVAHSNGLIEIGRASSALAAAMEGWAAKGIIELD